MQLCVDCFNMDNVRLKYTWRYVLVYKHSTFAGLRGEYAKIPVMPAPVMPTELNLEEQSIAVNQVNLRNKSITSLHQLSLVDALIDGKIDNRNREENNTLKKHYTKPNFNLHNRALTTASKTSSEAKDRRFGMPARAVGSRKYRSRFQYNI